MGSKESLHKQIIELRKLIKRKEKELARLEQKEEDLAFKKGICPRCGNQIYRAGGFAESLLLKCEKCSYELYVVD